ncbi:recombinase family protein [Leptolyngbyaceae cyanobacterium CCMR0082]|uniref:Recombinase family protein n=1 Tax=Adonisia turfae CCMR0082 TaxID=2304604 RepID=A0A6M0SJK7_9CYAN|nr:recombinase family protein [Adonisia turfae CCMR0082]
MLVLVGYIWTVNADDHTSRNEQYQALINAGVTAACIYEDLGCLRQAAHPELQECLQALQMGDTLVTWRLDGLACDRAALLDILRDLAKRQIGLKILDEQASLIDTAHISLDVIIGLIDAFTAFEDRAFRALKEKGVAAARARGQAFGPKRKMTASMLRQAMNLIANSDQSFTSIAKQFGFTRSGLYKYLNGDGSPKSPARQILEADTSTDED